MGVLRDIPEGVTDFTVSPNGYDDCPGAKYMSYPTAEMFMRIIYEEGLYYEYMIYAACVMYIAVVIAGIKLLWDSSKIKDEQIRGDVMLCVITPVVISTTCFAGIFFPRSNPALNTITLAYLMFAFWRCCILFIRIYGDCEHMSDILYRSGVDLKLNVLPICCFCCIPHIQPTVTNINVMKWLCIQTSIFRLSLQVVIDIIRTEGLCDHTAETKTLMYLDLVSTTLALYACAVFTKSTVSIMGKYQVENMFRVINITQGIYNFQRFILETLTNNDDVFADMYFHIDKYGIEVLEARVQADFWYNVLLIFWFLPLSALLLVFVRPGKCALFTMPVLPIAHIDTHGNFPAFRGSIPPSYRNSVVDYEIERNGGIEAVAEMERKSQRGSYSDEKY